MMSVYSPRGLMLAPMRRHMIAQHEVYDDEPYGLDLGLERTLLRNLEWDFGSS